MRNLFKNTRCNIFLSYHFRKVFCITLILVCNLLNSYAQNAYINDFRVNDDQTNREQYGSRISVDSAGNFVVMWNDRRNFPGFWTQVYCQIFNKSGSRIGNNFKIGLDTTYLFGLTTFNDGKFVCFWINFFNEANKAELLFQRFDQTGIPLNLPAKVIDTIYSSTALNYGDIASDRSGNFVTVWHFRPFATTNNVIYAQRFDNLGNKQGLPIVVNDTIGFFNISNTKVAMDKSGNFVVSWLDRRFNVSQQKYDVFFQRFNKDGEKLGNNIKVNDDNDTTKDQSLPWMDLNRFGNGNFVITWTDERFSNSELMVYHQIFDSSGNFIGSNKRTDQSLGNPFDSKVALDSNTRFIIGWNDNWYAGRYQYYARRYKSNGDTLGAIYMVPQLSPPGSGQFPSDIKILGDRVYTVWGDTRNGNPDVYCNVRSFQNPDTVIIGINPISNIIPAEYKLYPAYPNPFNPATTVKYSQPKNDDITIQLFDITGRTLRKWIYKDQKKGTYEIKVYSIDLPSGIYFLELKANSGFKSTQKLVLIK